MVDAHYTDPRLAALYDLDSGWSVDRDFYVELAGAKPKRILDLGCGTGLLSLALARRGHTVTAADPAEAMLAVARLKPDAGKVRWVTATAEDFRADTRFDLILMTGNAFMALLTEEAIAAAFATMRRHLAEDGRIAFESRNPRIDWSSAWDYEMPLATDKGAVIERRRFLQMDGPIMTFVFDYVFAGETITTQSRIRFRDREEIIDHLHAAGLHAEQVLGGWQGQAFDTLKSEQMIFSIARNSGD